MGKLMELLLSAKPSVDRATLLNSADLYGEGIFDSLDILVAISELSDAYNIDINGTSFSRRDFMTVETIAELIKRHGGVL